MNNTVENEIRTLQRQGKIVKTVVLGALAIGAVTGAFLVGGGYGFSAGKQTQHTRDIATVRNFLTHSSEETVFIDPRNIALAEVQNGICVHYPASVPAIHHVVYVAEQWMPCSPVTIAPYVHPVRVLKAIVAEDLK